MLLFTRDLTVSWMRTNNAAGRAVKAPKRHQAVTLETLARWCLIRSYLTSAANHGLTLLDTPTREWARKIFKSSRSKRRQLSDQLDKVFM